MDKWLLHEVRNPLGEQAWFRGNGQDPDGEIEENATKLPVTNSWVV